MISLASELTDSKGRHARGWLFLTRSGFSAHASRAGWRPSWNGADWRLRHCRTRGLWLCSDCLPGSYCLRSSFCSPMGGSTAARMRLWLWRGRSGGRSRSAGWRKLHG